MRKAIIFIYCMMQGCMSVMAQVQNSASPPTGTVQTQNTARLDGSGYVINYFGQYGGLYRFGYPIFTATNQFPFTITRSTFTVGATINSFADLVADITQSTAPTASLTGGTTIRVSSASTTNVNLNYAYGKQTGTQNIASATIGGSTTGITQNANGASGTYVAAVPSTTISSMVYTLLVVTVDSKNATSSQTVTIQNDRFWFRSASAVPDATIIQAQAGGGSVLSGSRAGTFVITASGTNYPGFAYPSRLGTLTSIKDANGLEAITSYNTGTLSFTNVAGYTETYRYYIAQNATAGNTTMTTL
jgi:hypothetical protein